MVNDRAQNDARRLGGLEMPAGRLDLRRPPLIPYSHRHLAMSLVGLGEFEKAKAALDEARRIAPDYVERGWRATSAMAIRNSIEED